MKLYINIKSMTLDDGIEHKIITSMNNAKLGMYDLIIEVSDDDKIIKDTLKTVYRKDKEKKDTEEIESTFFCVREKNTWWSFPLYEIVDGEIVNFNYTKYEYFQNTDRRNGMSAKINLLYDKSSENKIMRKTLKKILDYLGLEDESFSNYNNKVEKIIKKIPKGGK